MYETFESMHLVSTSIMVGIIWIVQIVHYPSFHYIGSDFYTEFQKFHMSRIGFVVVPPMLTEIVSGFILFFVFNITNVVFSLSILILAVIWISTGFIFSKIHGELLEGNNKNTKDKLINYNWIRTLFWTLRLLLICSV